MSNNKNKRRKPSASTAASTASRTPRPSKSATSSRDASPAQSPQPPLAHPKPRRIVKLTLPVQPNSAADASDDEPLTPPPKVSRAEVDAAIQEVLGPVKKYRSRSTCAQSLPSDEDRVDVDQDEVEDEGQGSKPTKKRKRASVVQEKEADKDSSDEEDSEDSDEDSEIEGASPIPSVNPSLLMKYHNLPCRFLYYHLFCPA